jgi:hypothetical protein
MIELRITSPSQKGLDNIMNTLKREYNICKQSLPYPYTDKETKKTKYTIYVGINAYACAER